MFSLFVTFFHHSIEAIFCEAIFWASAVTGTILFVLRVVMSMLGGMFGTGVDDLDSGDTTTEFIEGYISDEFMHESTSYTPHVMPSFKLLTLHSLAGFLMIFGWAGLACIHQYQFSVVTSFLVAAIIAFGFMVLTALLFWATRYLESPGAVFSLHKTVGLVGTVYQEIPVQGFGKIMVVINGTTHELLAASHNGQSIASFSLIKVVKVMDQAVSVIPLERAQS